MRKSSQFLSVVMLLATAWTLHAQGDRDHTVHLTLLDGTEKEAELRGISRSVLQGPGLNDQLKLDDLQRIERRGASASRLENPAVIVELNSGRLLAIKVHIADEKCVVEWLGGKETAISLDGVRGIRFKPDAASPEFEKSFAAPSPELDRIFLLDDAAAITSVTGLIESLDDRRLKVDINGQVREVPNDKLYGLVVAQPTATHQPPPYTALLQDGSKLSGNALSMDRNEAKLNVPRAGELVFLWSAVSRIEIRSSRVQFLSDMKPIVEVQQPLVTLGLAAQRDKSAAGGPLVLADRLYDKGLGVHAHSRLTFATDGKWNTLAATIGLDSDRGSKGDCIFKVLADGEEVFAQRMLGSDAAKELNLDISGRQQVTLLVEPGEGLDLADHANWCEARFIRNK